MRRSYKTLVKQTLKVLKNEGGTVDIYALAYMLDISPTTARRVAKTISAVFGCAIEGDRVVCDPKLMNEEEVE
jgi:hypothetical protein